LYVQAPAALFSPYGAALGAKAGLVASVLVIALGHRLWRLRRLNADAYDLAAWKRFDRWLSWEGVLAIAIVMVAAGMSQVPPPE
ncbi:MAG: CopD family protein, partial [Candidatus Sericytochromatia bacterium]